MWVLRRVDQHGGYVANTGVGVRASYTHDLRYARIFRTQEDAERERCVENERAERVEDQLQKPR